MGGDMPPDAPEAGSPVTSAEVAQALRGAVKVKRYQAGDVLVERPSVGELIDLQREVKADEAQKSRDGGMYVGLEFGSG
jgi:hypothetical protein